MRKILSPLGCSKETRKEQHNLGDANAQHNLGIMYLNGQGVEADIAKTRVLWTASAAQGHEKAMENLKILEMEMKKNRTKNATKNTK